MKPLNESSSAVSPLERAARAVAGVAAIARKHRRLSTTTLQRAVSAAALLIVTRVFGQAPAEQVPAPDVTAAPQKAPAASQPDAAEKATPFLRVVDVKGKSIELQIAAREYVRADGTGPRVALVGVTHIGDSAFYRSLQKALASYDVVLYESVRPEGTSKPGGDTPEARADSTKSSMRFVRGLIETYRHQHDGYPANLESLREFVVAEDPRLAEFLATASVDAWGRTLQYALLAGAADPDKAAAGGGYALLSLGADGRPGGEGEAADLNLREEPAPDPLALSKEDGLQSQLADALGLEFQLDAMDYGQPTWRCSDMAMDEISRRLQAKGLDFDVLGGTLAGSSLPAKAIKLLLGLMKMADTFMEGAITDTFKVVMIEMLGDPALMDVSMQQLGAGFGEVIINDRNQVPLNDLRAIAESEPEVKSVAIFYGAGHMPDLEAQLLAAGYVPAEGGDQWLGAIKVDLTQSAVSPAEINRIRGMMKQMIRQQMRAK